MMKNWKRTKESVDGAFGWTYESRSRSMCFVDCDAEGWIDLTQLEPDADWFGAIQVIKEWTDIKSLNSAGFIVPKAASFPGGYLFEFTTANFIVSRWQPQSNLPQAEEGMRPDRTPYDRWRRSPVPPEKRAGKLSGSEMEAMLNSLPFSKRVIALNGLVLRAKSLPELHKKVRAALATARKNGMLIAMSSNDRQFKDMRDRAENRARLKRDKKT